MRIGYEHPDSLITYPQVNNLSGCERVNSGHIFSGPALDGAGARTGSPRTADENRGQQKSWPPLA